MNINTGFKYWDLFEERIQETTECLVANKQIPIRRIAVHLTNKCNLKCSYCNECQGVNVLDKKILFNLLDEFSDMGGGIVHITGGEPTIVNYLPEAIDYTSKYDNLKFNLNTNCVKRLSKESYSKIYRLKTSLDTYNKEKFDKLVGIKGTFNKVIENLRYIHELEDKPTLSITYTVSKQTYKDIPKFLKFYYENFPNFYAVFFSSYKGFNEDFMFSKSEVKDLFENIVPQMKEIAEKNNDNNTKWLFEHSHTQRTFNANIRFPENRNIPCYIQMSELLINEVGDLWHCSHLFRDKILPFGNIKDFTLKDIVKNKELKNFLHLKCLYGCNRKLVMFNKNVNKRLIKSKRENKNG